MHAKIPCKGRLAVLVRENLRLARRSNSGQLGRVLLGRLRELTINYGLSLALGDCTFLDGSW
jgi:hypothetical protein